ncbi:nuclear transport factor 2 family protein [Streptomyces sp. NPDC057245]|uniref:nuclear transport factor 2 family protein n=1 Tax=Streptomyces sp. NPDC057245 TaxID=3346065 RepID=UPI00364343F4
MTAFEVEQIAERVRRYYALVDDGDVRGVVGLFADRAVYERPGYEPIVGRDGLDAFYRGERVIDTGSHTVVSLVVGTGDAAVEGEFHGTLKDGSEVDLRFADFFRLNEDLLFEARNTYFFSPMV